MKRMNKNEWQYSISALYGLVMAMHNNGLAFDSKGIHEVTKQTSGEWKDGCALLFPVLSEDLNRG